MQPGERRDLAAFDFTAPKDIHLQQALLVLSHTVPLLSIGCVRLSRQTELLAGTIISVSAEMFANHFLSQKKPHHFEE